MLAHNVFFDLKDGSDEAAGALLAGCERWLKPHEGIVFFACGLRVAEHPARCQRLGVRRRPCTSCSPTRRRMTHTQESAPHKRFIAAFKPNWRGVRVFDSAWEASGS